MNATLDTLLKIPVSAVEAGLLTMKASMRTMQESMATVTGHKTGAKMVNPPVNGPQDLDQSISTFINHLIRIGRLTRPQAGALAESFQQVIHSARASFGNLDLRDPRSLALPL